jgi:hypothetical protein
LPTEKVFRCGLLARNPAELATTLGRECLRRYLQGLPVTERTDFRKPGFREPARSGRRAG